MSLEILVIKPQGFDLTIHQYQYYILFHIILNNKNKMITDPGLTFLVGKMLKK